MRICKDSSLWHFARGFVIARRVNNANATKQSTYCHSERSEESQKKQNLWIFRLTAQYDNKKRQRMDCFDFLQKSRNDESIADSFVHFVFARRFIAKANQKINTKGVKNEP